jgi:hypothetical protein
MMLLLPRRDCACALIARHDNAMFIYTKKHLDNQGIGVWKTGYPRIGE